MFTFNKNTNFISENASVPVRNAISVLERDRDKVFVNSNKPGGSVVLVTKSMARSISDTESKKIYSRKNILRRNGLKSVFLQTKLYCMPRAIRGSFMDCFI